VSVIKTGDTVAANQLIKAVAATATATILTRIAASFRCSPCYTPKIWRHELRWRRAGF